MGNLLKVLTREIENYPHFFLDFESKCGGAVGQKLDGGGGVACSALSPSASALNDQTVKASSYSLLFFPRPPLGSVATSRSIASDRPSLIKQLSFLPFFGGSLTSHMLFLLSFSFLSLAETKWGIY